MSVLYIFEVVMPIPTSLTVVPILISSKAEVAIVEVVVHSFITVQAEMANHISSKYNQSTYYNLI